MEDMFSDVYTQYTDMTGEIAVDFHQSMVDVNRMAEKYGVDTDHYQVIALRIYWEMTDASVHFYGVNMEKVNGAGFKNMPDYAVANDGVLPVTVFHKFIPVSDVLKEFKRFHFKIRSRIKYHTRCEYDPVEPIEL
jgi:hypothetical protein